MVWRHPAAHHSYSAHHPPTATAFRDRLPINPQLHQATVRCCHVSLLCWRMRGMHAVLQKVTGLSAQSRHTGRNSWWWGIFSFRRLFTLISLSGFRCTVNDNLFNLSGDSLYWFESLVSRLQSSTNDDFVLPLMTRSLCWFESVESRLRSTNDDFIVLLLITRSLCWFESSVSRLQSTNDDFVPLLMTRSSCWFESVVCCLQSTRLKILMWFASLLMSRSLCWFESVVFSLQMVTFSACLVTLNADMVSRLQSTDDNVFHPTEV